LLEGVVVGMRKLDWLRGLSVLVVEDNELIRAVEVDLLRALGCDVAATANAEDALASLDDPRIALLITDVRLPGPFDGIALSLTAKHRRPELRVLLVGADLEHLPPEDLRAIADEGMRKPFTVGEFEEHLANLARHFDGAPA
jgi:DNA-binding NtrC family response regulator